VQVKGYQFTVPEGVVSLEVQLNNRTGNPRMALISGSRLPYPDGSVNEFGTGGGQASTPAGGMARVIADSLITVPNPPAGTYSLTLRADDLSSVYPDATADLVIVAKPRTVMNFAASQNGNGFSNSDTKQLADAQKQFYEIAVPATLSGQPVLGWLLKVNHGQGDTTLKIYKQWGNPGSGTRRTSLPHLQRDLVHRGHGHRPDPIHDHQSAGDPGAPRVDHACRSQLQLRRQWQ
jgi:hypothetical protein